jgi:hypothetical protein
MFAVIWREAALDELADHFVRADGQRRDLIEQTVLRFNARLAVDPIHFGESRSGRTRIAVDGRSAIYFRVDDAQQVVVVTHFRTS